MPSAPNSLSVGREVLKNAIPLGIVLAALLAFFLLSAQKTPPGGGGQKSTTPLVETVTIAKHKGDLDIEVDGVVVPFREIEVGAEVAGRITQKSPQCRAGRYVSKGMTLLTIDQTDYNIEVKRLKNQLEKAKANLAELEVEIDNTEELIKLAKEDVDLQEKDRLRLVELAKRTSVPQADLDRARRNELASRNTLRTLQNQLKLNQARRKRLELERDLVAVELSKAQEDFKRTVIKAPVDGLIVNDAVEEQSFVQRGTPLFTVEDTSRAEVKCSLLAEELAWILEQSENIQGQAESIPELANEDLPEVPDERYQLPSTAVTVEYTLAGNTYTWKGQLWRMEGTGIDERTRTVPCRVLVSRPWEPQPDEDGERTETAIPLRRGMFVTVKIHTQPQANLLKIPDRAVRPGAAGNVVWKIAGGKLRVVPIEVARSVRGGVLIREKPSDLSLGDKIVVSPLAVAEDGMEIRERKQP